MNYLRRAVLSVVCYDRGNPLTRSNWCVSPRNISLISAFTLCCSLFFFFSYFFFAYICNSVVYYSALLSNFYRRAKAPPPLGQDLSAYYFIDASLYGYNEVSCVVPSSPYVRVIVSFVLLICSSFLCPLLFYSDAAEIFFTSSRIPFTSAFSVVFTQTRSAVNCSALLLSNPRCT